MTMKKRAYQGGSIATFVVVALVLFLGLTGAVQYVKQRGEVARKEQAIANSDDSDESSGESVSNPYGDKNESQDQEEATQVSSLSSPSSASTVATASATLPQGGPSGLASDLLAVFAISTTSTMYYVSVRKAKATL